MRLIIGGERMDLNVRAFRVVQAAVSEPLTQNKRKESSRKGGRIGGPARAAAISPERRTEIAKRASLARWRKVRTNAEITANASEIER
jgi:hypothetical protein